MVDGGDSVTGGRGILETVVIAGQELRRSSVNAVAVDVLYLFTTAFFATLAIRGFWPALIAVFPLVVLLSFAWMSSRLFLFTNIVVIAVSIAVTRAGMMPL
ncbi:hypothetical protein OB919_01170 [Halobacteria archaeon AArc-curdl1]|uniref:Uncharacterized protein n=1 Tax=Natronosalvus hydrolyticus TaxID=2979988 RepID=A0AAP2Z4J5_9EURY|nr:hypothetical protein [Halobacteria archaeon AArc-curdl1]